MPLALDPQARFSVVLKTDQGKTPAPTFHFRSANVRQWIQVVNQLEGVKQEASGANALPFLISAIRINLVGWSNMIGPAGEIPYDADKLETIINPAEANELLD